MRQIEFPGHRREPEDGDCVARAPNAFCTWLIDLIDAPSFLGICFVVYMATRIGVLFVGPVEQSSDFAWYYGRALEITSGSGYAEGGALTAFWPIGWPGFLAAVFMVTGPSVQAAQIANLVLAALVFALSALLGTSLCRNRLVGRLTVLILALYPNQIGYIPLISAEIFYEFLLLLGIYLLINERLLLTLLAGFVFGVGTLTKTQTFLLPGFILVCVFITRPSKNSLFRVTRTIWVVYIVMVLVIAPWTYRNYEVFDAFIPISTNGGWTLLTGNNPEAKGDYTPDTVLAEGITHNPAEQVAMDRLARAKAITWIRGNPVGFIELMPRKLLRLWAPDGEAEWFYQRGFDRYKSYVLLFRSFRGLNQVYYFAILLLALPSMWLLPKGRANASPWTMVGLELCVYMTLISLVFSGQSRFHFALMPFLAIYAASNLILFLSKYSGRPQVGWGKEAII